MTTPLNRGPSISGLNLSRDAISPARVAALAEGAVQSDPHPDHVDHHDDHSAAHNEIYPQETMMQRGMGKLWYYAGKASNKVMANLKKLETPLTVQAMVRADGQKLHLYHELNWDARVRYESTLHPDEQQYLRNRLSLISQYRSLSRFLGLPDGELLNPDDIPVIALGGSEGGYKAYLGFAATFDVCKELGLWDIISYVGGVSLSCSALAAYMTWAERNTQTLLSQQSATASQHPLGAAAADRVANSPYGAYYLFGSLLHKVENGVPLGMLDIYGSFLTSYQWLAPPHYGVVDDQYPPFLDRQWFQWSKTFDRAGIRDGNEPFPILTAVRDLQRDKMNKAGSKSGTGEWFEFNPVEMGSEELNAWIPTWSFGRKFVDGHTILRNPEQSLSLILGLCASQPAIPLTEYLTQIAQGLPYNIFGDSASRIANADQSANWTSGTSGRGPNDQRTHPTANEPNPFAKIGYNNPDPNKTGSIDGGEYLYLTDAAFKHSFPTHSFLNKGRGVDVIINCDFSDAGSKGGNESIEKIKEFGREKGVEFVARSNRPPVQPLNGPASAEEITRRFEGRYAEILDGRFGDGTGRKGVTMVQVPLLPNKAQPSYDPAHAEFSNSFNLVWTPEQVLKITETQKANMKEAIATIKAVIREAYERKKAARLGQTVPTPTPTPQAQPQVQPQVQPQAQAPPIIVSPIPIPSSATPHAASRGGSDALESAASSVATTASTAAVPIPPPPASTPQASLPTGPATDFDTPNPADEPSEPPPAYDNSTRAPVVPEKATYRPPTDGSGPSS
jgi:phospholipase A2